HLADIDLGRIAFRGDLHGLVDGDVRDVGLDDLGAGDARGGRLQIEHVRHVQGRGAGAGVGVATHDATVGGRADDGQFDVVCGLITTGAGALHRRLLRAEAGLGLGDGVAGLVHALGGDEVGGDQLLQAVVFALGRGDVDVDQAQLALGFGQGGRGG